MPGVQHLLALPEMRKEVVGARHRLMHEEEHGPEVPLDWQLGSRSRVPKWKKTLTGECLETFPLRFQ
eukprot:520220-Prorocentrum_lima.AAC.1